MIDICIPTFNRASRLERLLAAIAAEIDDRFRVIVIDNASTDDTPHVVARAARHWPGQGLAVHRHRANIGGNANILRCFEVGTSEWTWIMGDDDLPEPGSLASVAETVAVQADAVWINFATTLLDHATVERRTWRTARGAREFITAVDSFSNTLFITANVFRAGPLLPYLRFGYQKIGTCAPHIATLLTFLADHPRDAVVFSPTRVAIWEPPAANDAWAHRPVFMGLAQLAQLAPDDESRAALLDVIGRDTFDRHPLITSATLDVLAGSRDVLADQVGHAACLATAAPRRTRSLLAWALLLAIADHGGRVAIRRLRQLWPWQSRRSIGMGAMAEMLRCSRV